MRSNGDKTWKTVRKEESKTLVQHILNINTQLRRESTEVIEDIPYIRYLFPSGQATLPMMHLLNSSLFSFTLNKDKTELIKGDLVSALETLYYSIHIGLSSIGGISSNAMILFNTVLLNIGYKPIPIYASDFAAYCLNPEDFCRYMIFVIQNVEGQEIIHDIPEILRVPKNFIPALSKSK
jgi:hypothetical protein